MRELAAKQAEAEILSSEDLPDEKSDIDTRPLRMVNQRTFTFEGEHDIRTGIDADGEIWLVAWDIAEVFTNKTHFSIRVLLLWDDMVNKLSSKQHKHIMLCEPDTHVYYEMTGVNISGLYELMRRLQKEVDTDYVQTTARKFWSWVTTEVVFPMLEFANKQRSDNKPEHVGNSDMLPTGLEYEDKEPEEHESDPKVQKAEAVLRRIEQAQKQRKQQELQLDEVPDDEEIETLENAAMAAAHSKYKPIRCKLVKQPEQAPRNPRRKSVTLLEFTELLKFNGIDIPLNKLMQYFRQCEWLDKAPRILPTSFALNSGLFTIVTKRFPDGSMTRRTKLTVKGQWYFLRMFATLKATAFTFACNEIFAKLGLDFDEINEHQYHSSKKLKRSVIKATTDITRHFLNTIGIGKGSK